MSETPRPPLEYLQTAREDADRKAEEARRFLDVLAPKFKEIAEFDTKLRAVIDHLAEDAAVAQDTGKEKGTSGNTLRTIEGLLAEIKSEYESENDPAEAIKRLRDIVDATIQRAGMHGKGKLDRMKVEIDTLTASDSV